VPLRSRDKQQMATKKAGQLRSPTSLPATHRRGVRNRLAPRPASVSTNAGRLPTRSRMPTLLRISSVTRRRWFARVNACSTLAAYVTPAGLLVLGCFAALPETLEARMARSMSGAQ